MPGITPERLGLLTTLLRYENNDLSWTAQRLHPVVHVVFTRLCVNAVSMADAEGEVTRLLERWREGDPDVLESLIPLVYGQLHRIAKGYMRREREDHTLQPTALVNEVYMRLLNQRKITWHDRGHFYTFAARMMRNILKDHARAHLAERRGGPGAIRLPLSDEIAWVGTSSAEILDLNRALDRLEQLDQRKAHLVELRFFLALTMEETAEVLSISMATAERDLKFSRSWLFHELNAARGETV